MHCQNKRKLDKLMSDFFCLFVLVCQHNMNFIAKQIYVMVPHSKLDFFFFSLLVRPLLKAQKLKSTTVTDEQTFVADSLHIEST